MTDIDVIFNIANNDDIVLRLRIIEQWRLSGLFLLVFLERSHESSLLGVGLESSVAELGGGVDELEVDVLQSSLLGVGQERLSQGQDSLLRSNAATLEHDEVLLDLSIVRESSHGVDGLVRQIVVGGGVVLNQLSVLHLESLTDSVDLLVDLSSMMVALLSSSGHGELDSAWMPSSNTGDLPQTLVSLPGQLLGVPSAGDALESVTLGDADDVDHLVSGKDSGDRNLLLEVVPGKVNLVSDGSSVQLDLHDVGLLLSATQDFHLCVDNNTDGGAVLLHLCQLLLDLLLSEIISPLGAGLSEGLLLGLRPVLVEPSLSLFSNMLSPDSLESSHTSWSLDVSNNTNADHWWSLDNGDGLDDFLLVDLGAGSVHLPDDVGHAGLVAHEGSQVDRLAWVILGESLDLASMPLGSLLGEKSLGSVTGCLELPVRHCVSCRSESSNIS